MEQSGTRLEQPGPLWNSSSVAIWSPSGGVWRHLVPSGAVWDQFSGSGHTRLGPVWSYLRARHWPSRVCTLGPSGALLEPCTEVLSSAHQPFDPQNCKLAIPPFPSTIPVHSFQSSNCRLPFSSPMHEPTENPVYVYSYIFMIDT